MILDRIEHAPAYRGLGEGVAVALDYLQQNDFTALAPGRYEVHPSGVFAMVQRYRTRSLSQAIWESHRQHIDVQYLVQGRERMGYVSLAAAPPVSEPYDPAKDAAFYDGNGHGDLFEIAVGGFAIFTPQDIHAPGLVTGTPAVPAEVLKVVVKIPVRAAGGPCGF